MPPGHPRARSSIEGSSNSVHNANPAGKGRKKAPGPHSTTVSSVRQRPQSALLLPKGRPASAGASSRADHTIGPWAAHGAKAFQQMDLASESALDLQLIAKDETLVDLDMVGMKLETREWVHALRMLGSHPSVQRIDMRGMHLTKTRQEELLEVLAVNTRILEVSVDDPDLQREINEGPIQSNIALRDAKVEAQHQKVLAHHREQKQFQNREDIVILTKIETEKRTELIALEKVVWVELTEYSTKETSAAHLREVHQREMELFLTRVQKVVNRSCVARYKEYFQTFIRPFFLWRNEQETISREWVESEETQARNDLRKQYFASWEHHTLLYRRRIKAELRIFHDIMGEQMGARKHIDKREANAWSTLMEAIKAMHKRNRDLQDYIENRIAEDGKRRAARAAELESRRSFRQEKLAKELVRLHNIHTNDRDRLLRNEMVARMRVVQVEPQYFALLSELSRLCSIVLVGKCRCGDALRAKDAIFKEDAVLTARSQEAAAIRLHYPSLNRGQVVAPDLSLELSLPSKWTERCVHVINEVNSSLAHFRKVYSSANAKIQLQQMQLEDLDKKYGIGVEFAEFFSAVEPYLSIKDISAVDTADWVRRKQRIQGGEVILRAQGPPSEDYTCSFNMPTLPTVETLRMFVVDQVVDNPNSSSFVLATNGVFDEKDLAELLRLVQVKASLVPGCPLPFVQTVEMEIRLRMFHLRDRHGKVLYAREPHTVLHTVQARVLVAKPLISMPKAPQGWQVGQEELYVFQGVKVDIPPTVDAEGNLVEKIGANVTMDGAGVTVRFVSDVTEHDLLLTSSATIGNRAPPQTDRGNAAELAPDASSSFGAPSAAGVTPRPGYSVQSTGLQTPQTLPLEIPDLPPVVGCAPFPRPLYYEEMEIGEVLEGEIESLEHLRTTQGFDFVHACRQMHFRFSGRYATVRRVEQMLRDIAFYNRSQAPIVGKREILLELHYGAATCDCRSSVGVEQDQHPTTLSLPNIELFYHAPCCGEVLEEHLSHTLVSSLPIFPDALLADPSSSYFAGGHLKVFCWGYRLGDTLSLEEGNGIRIQEKPKRRHSTSSLEGELREKSSAGSTAESEATPVYSIFYNEEEVATMECKLPALILSGEERIKLRVTKKKKPHRIALDDVFTNDLTFPPHDSLTINGPQELIISFARTGVASIDACNALLHNIRFSNHCLLPKVGDRDIMLELVTGSQGDHRSSGAGVSLINSSDNKTSVFRETVVLHVAHPLLRVQSRHTAMKYIEGSGWKLLPSIHCSLAEGEPEPVFNSAVLRVSILGRKAEHDYLWLRSDDLLIVGAQSESIFIDKMPAFRRVVSTFSMGESTIADSTARGNVIYRMAKVFLKTDGSEVASLTYDEDEKTLSIEFSPQRLGQEPMGRDVVSYFLKSLAFYTSHTLAEHPHRSLRVDISDRDQQPGVAQLFFKAFLRLEDDPSEFIVPTSPAVYRHGLQFLPGAFPDLPVAPIIESMVSDTDTEFYDGGSLVAHLGPGATKGDRLYFMSLASQQLQYETVNSPPVTLVDLKGNDLILYETGKRIGVLDYFTVPEQPGVTHLRIMFLHVEGRLKKSLVPISAVTHMLNCICYISSAVDRVKTGFRTILLSIEDGSNPAHGKGQVQVEVQQPMVHLAGGAPRIDTFYFIGAAGTQLAQKVLTTPLRDEGWTTGYIDFDVQEPCHPAESLNFNPIAFVGTTFALKEVPSEKRESLWSEGGAHQIEMGSFPGKPLPPDVGVLLLDHHGLVMGRFVATPHRITLYLLPSSKFTGKHFDTFLKSVTYEHKAAQPKQTRTVVLRVSEGFRRGGANSIEIQIKLGVKGASGK